MHVVLGCAAALVVFFCGATAAGPTITGQAQIHVHVPLKIWPRPSSEWIHGDAVLHLGLVGSERTGWSFSGAGEVLPGPVLHRALRRFDAALVAARANGGQQHEPLEMQAAIKPALRLRLWSFDETLTGAVDESYRFNVTAEGITLSARTVWGARHALDSLAQLAGPDGSIRHADVADSPEYSYRGLMLSPGQRFVRLFRPPTYSCGCEREVRSLTPSRVDDPRAADNVPGRHGDFADERGPDLCPPVPIITFSAPQFRSCCQPPLLRIGWVRSSSHPAMGSRSCTSTSRSSAATLSSPRHSLRYPRLNLSAPTPPSPSRY